MSGFRDIVRLIDWKEEEEDEEDQEDEQEEE